MLLHFVQEKLNLVVDLDEPEVWAQSLYEQVESFKRASQMGPCIPNWRLCLKVFHILFVVKENTTTMLLCDTCQ